MGPLFVVSLSLSTAMAHMKTILVTGANKGVGRAIVEKLLEDFEDTYVYLGARDAGRGLHACAEIEAKVPSAAGRLEFLKLDVADDASVLRAAEAVANARGSIHAVMNNAGIGFGRDFAETLETNFYGTMRVCDAFISLLENRDPPGRVVNMASASAPNFVSRCGVPEHRTILSKPETATFDQLLALAKFYEDKTDYENVAYGLSKACLNAYTYLLSRKHPNLLVNSCTPGFILTDLTRGMGASKSPADGAKAPVYLLMDDEVATLPTGRYYGSDAKRSPLDRYREPGSPPYDGLP